MKSTLLDTKSAKHPKNLDIRGSRLKHTTQATRVVEMPLETERKLYSKYLLLLIQLLGSACLVRYFQLETKAFFELLLLLIGGFAIHYHLPLRFRLPFFVCVSVVSIGWVLGPLNGAWLIAIGLALIGICHIPLSISVRLALLLIAGTALAIARAGWAPVPWPAALWPILGSMFMFRLLVYLYDRRFDASPATFSSTLAYFFLPPNLCFPLFPVVDYRTFRRTYYDTERHHIYQTGVQWIVRGLVQLILYRIV
jgi:hypothetical protein